MAAQGILKNLEGIERKQKKKLAAGPVSRIRREVLQLRKLLNSKLQRLSKVSILSLTGVFASHLRHTRKTSPETKFNSRGYPSLPEGCRDRQSKAQPRPQWF
jgi:hypothetical protein